MDEETGLYYYGARYYNPRESIFLSVDPLTEMTGTPYQYCYQNPINYTDPTGMIPGDPENGETRSTSSGGTEVYDDGSWHKTIDPVVVVAKRSFWRGFGRSIGGFFGGMWKDIKTWPASVGLKGKDEAVKVYQEETQERLEAADAVWYTVHNTSEVLENIKSDSELKGELSGNTFAVIGTAIVTRGKGGGKIIPKVVTQEWRNILKGKGTKIIRNGVHVTVDSRNRKWEGAFEWKVSKDPSGSKTINGTRIVEHPDGRWGYVIDHDYTKIYEIPTSSPVPYMNK